MTKQEEITIADLNGRLKGARIDEDDANWIKCLIFERDTVIKLLFEWLSREEGNEPSEKTIEVLKRLRCTFDGEWHLPA